MQVFIMAMAIHINLPMKDFSMIQVSRKSKMAEDISFIILVHALWDGLMILIMNALVNNWLE